jgi:ribose transport system substrate-binding protein
MKHGGLYKEENPDGGESMSIGTSRKVVPAAIGLVALAITFAACGSSSDSSSTSSGGSATTSSGGTADLAAANSAIKPYIGQPGAFPVIEKLKKLPKGADVVYMDCGTPICALFWTLIQPAGQTMGVNLTRVKAGSAANTVSAAFDTVVSEKPDAVIVTAINVELWKSQLKQLQDANIPVVTTGITGTAPYGIESPQAAENASNLEGGLMADYVAAKMGTDSKAVMYDVPEIPFTGVVASAFEKELAKVCPNCSVRTVHVPVATIGNTAPTQIVSDLQANPDTTVAAFATDETETGLPSALQAAGIKVKTIGNSPGPTNLEYLKEGKETAALAVDLPVLIWTTLDQAAREMGNQKLAGDEAKGITDVQFLTKPDIVFPPAKGWTGYPDFAKRFSTLWGVGG